MFNSIIKKIAGPIDNIKGYKGFRTLKTTIPREVFLYLYMSLFTALGISIPIYFVLHPNIIYLLSFEVGTAIIVFRLLAAANAFGLLKDQVFMNELLLANKFNPLKVINEFEIELAGIVQNPMANHEQKELMVKEFMDRVFINNGKLALELLTRSNYNTRSFLSILPGELTEILYRYYIKE